MIDTGKAAPRFFEDVAVGERTRTGSVTLTRDSIVAFAKLYDPQPMHLDEEAAKTTLFGQLVASGWQTLNLTMRLMVEAKPLGTTPLVGIEINEIRFTRPVFPGDSLSAELEIMKKWLSTTRPDRGFLQGRTVTFNQKGIDVSTQLWTMLVPVRTP
jgi:acyl dehydratase